MPDSNYNAAIMAGYAQAIGSGLNAFSTGNLNRKNRKFAQEMYNRQRADALADWDRQNAYNLPSAQMQRFKDAGLNPNLIYGRANEGAPLTSVDFKQPQTSVPQIGDAFQGFASVIDQISNLEMRQAQTDNLRTQNNVLQADAALKYAQIRATDIGSERKYFDLDLAQELRQTSVDAKRELLRQTATQTDLSLKRDLREELKTASSLSEAAERTINLVERRGQMRLENARTREDIIRIKEDANKIREQISLMSKDGILKDLDVQLSKANIRPGDPIWYRSIGLVLDALMDADWESLARKGFLRR